MTSFLCVLASWGAKWTNALKQMKISVGNKSPFFGGGGGKRTFWRGKVFWSREKWVEIEESRKSQNTSSWKGCRRDHGVQPPAPHSTSQTRTMSSSSSGLCPLLWGAVPCPPPSGAQPFPDPLTIPWHSSCESCSHYEASPQLLRSGLSKPSVAAAVPRTSCPPVPSPAL